VVVVVVAVAAEVPVAVVVAATNKTSPTKCEYSRNSLLY